MKKLFAILMMMIMLCAMALPVHAETLPGGWTAAEDTTVTDEAAEALKKATEGMIGCAYEAVAVLGTQVVAGVNYCLLCKLTPVVPNAVAHYAFVRVWQKVDGTAELLDVTDCMENVNGEELGTWTAVQDAAVTDEAAEALKKATEVMLGVEFAPVALLGTQVVAGVNYSMLVRVHVVGPEGGDHFGIIRVWQKTDGTAEVLDIQDVQLWVSEETV